MSSKVDLEYVVDAEELLLRSLNFPTVAPDQLVLVALEGEPHPVVVVKRLAGVEAMLDAREGYTLTLRVELTPGVPFYQMPLPQLLVELQSDVYPELQTRFAVPARHLGWLRGVQLFGGFCIAGNTQRALAVDVNDTLCETVLELMVLASELWHEANGETPLPLEWDGE